MGRDLPLSQAAPRLRQFSTISLGICARRENPRDSRRIGNHTQIPWIQRSPRPFPTFPPGGASAAPNALRAGLCSFPPRIPTPAAFHGPGGAQIQLLPTPTLGCGWWESRGAGIPGRSSGTRSCPGCHPSRGAAVPAPAPWAANPAWNHARGERGSHPAQPRAAEHSHTLGWLRVFLLQTEQKIPENDNLTEI